ncbi:alpha/beta fold hydrolase [uncultured Sphingosinicella sp.]|jgi:dipeptidyl aminopeptidase/acylaminoacyl peptidase|uniref:alpha/beta hydrolase family protein n=1 Tax=uncultured Sphingosinicella sp. TaxID=478748 RepID=UPI0030D9C604
MLLVTALIASLAASTAPETPAAGKGAANNFARSADAREGALDSFTNTGTDDPAALLKHLQQEIYVNQQLAILTQFRLDYSDRIRLSTEYVNSDGELIPTHVFMPVKASNARRPAVVMVHGGFHERLEPSWFPLIEAVVEAGYVVLFPEYRGSRGYGDAIYQNDYGNTDVADVLAAARYAATRPDIDGGRIGILGQSRGGMVTLLAIERAPKQFKAAVDIVGLTDFVAYMSYKPDYRRKEIAETNPSFKGKLPHENLPAYINVSPINFVDKIEAPVLVLATSGDKIVPHTIHTGRLIDALKANGKVHEARIYDEAPGGHVFMKGATPERDDALKRIVAWFNRWMGPAR